MGWLVVHAAATWALFGLIWVVQLVVYPQFARAGAAGFRRYHEEHCRRMGWVVGPLMGAEGVAAIALLVAPPPGVAMLELVVGGALAVGNAAATGLAAVPLHRRLAAGFDPALQRRLLAVNGLRTALWTLRALLAARWLL